MVQIIKLSIANILSKLYPTYTIYDDEVQSGMRQPCFVVISYDQEYQKSMGDLYRGLAFFNISYITDNQLPHNNMDNVGITVARELAKGAEGFRFLDIKTNKENGILNITFNIPYRELESVDYSKMNSLTQKQINRR